MQGNDVNAEGAHNKGDRPVPLRAVSADDDVSGDPVDTDAAPALDTAAQSRLAERFDLLEKSNTRMRVGLWLSMVAIIALGAHALFPAATIVKQTLMESEEVKLVDNSGATRMFLRMYSRVPVLQLLDSNGKPRMSLGLRFDDTPFLDLSDKTGRTRATFEMTEEDEPTLKLFNKDGEVSFAIN
jgi:hypothetical protein